MTFDLECTPITDRGALIVGQDARPLVYPTMCQDPLFGSLQAPAGNQVITVPQNPAHFTDSVQMAPVRPSPAIESGRYSFLPKEDDVRKVAMNSWNFAAGYLPGYKSEKPVTGTQLLRPILNVPIDKNGPMYGGEPTHGPWNTMPDQGFSMYDPRYRAPVFPKSGSERPSVPWSGAGTAPKPSPAVPGMGPMGVPGRF